MSTRTIQQQQDDALQLLEGIVALETLYMELLAHIQGERLAERLRSVCERLIYNYRRVEQLRAADPVFAATLAQWESPLPPNEPLH